MRNEFTTGLTHEQTYATTREMRARQLITDVLSTPAMIGLIERTCVELTTPYLEEHEQTVGIHVDMRHTAPTKIGQSVTVAVQVLEVKENKIRFSVSAHNDQGAKIGEGFHRRAIIDTKRFGGSS
jgi:fluoroacetyl-CoA thioesterase